MSFSLRNDRARLEYKGSTLNTLFAQRRNIIRPSFYRMIRDVLRFEGEALALLDNNFGHVTLGKFLESGKYSKEFVEHYIVPMGAAIWSSKAERMLKMPAAFFIRFFRNHGLLSVDNRPVWRVIKGGSARYVERLVAGHRDRIHLNSPVQQIRRHADHIELKVAGSEPQFFDQVFLACHSDQALRMLADATKEEREVLSSIRYQKNQAVLHTDTSLMPKRKLAWAAWNYHAPEKQDERITLTYNMNILQGLDAPEQFCVTLNNREAIDSRRVLKSIDYSHPIFDDKAVAAQARHEEINGPRRTYFCGAYWRYGFHEDGVLSALKAVDHFRRRSVHEQRDFRRLG
jgi:predicted NAD/FAD-binding protein